ncbi:MAG TPA: hypothetical protein VI685_03835 [Candidatus Angelobacter sp.]
MNTIKIIAKRHRWPCQPYFALSPEANRSVPEQKPNQSPNPERISPYFSITLPKLPIPSVAEEMSDFGAF